MFGREGFKIVSQNFSTDLRKSQVVQEYLVFLRNARKKEKEGKIDGKKERKREKERWKERKKERRREILKENATFDIFQMNGALGNKKIEINF